MGQEQLTIWVRGQVSEDTWEWLESQAAGVNADPTALALNKAFAMIPRKTGGGAAGSGPGRVGVGGNVDAYGPPRGPGSADTANASADMALHVAHWSLDRLCRVWLLTQIDPTDKAAYVKKIEGLYSGAAMNELVALYSALPILAYPDEWRKRCAEGIRSNIGTVLDAIMYENPYPGGYLDEPAWNQMILKAFFNEKAIHRIIGVEARANKELSLALFDYAQERRSAGRPVNPEIWALIRKFVDYVLQ